MWDIGNWGSRGWQGSPVAHRTGRQRWVRVLIVLSAFRQSTSVLCSTGHRLRANSCPPCVLVTSASVLRVRPGQGQGRGGGRAGACLVSSGPLPSGKCPRQRRALERGLMEEDGYRMKFACYYPRVEYGQPSRGPVPGPPSGSLCLSPSCHRPPCSLFAPTPACRPPSLGAAHLPFLLLDSFPGFQVKVLREDARAAFRLFETSIAQVLHFSMPGTAGGREGCGAEGARSGVGARLPGRGRVRRSLS